MAPSVPPATRATWIAACTALVAVSLFAVEALVTTQAKGIRSTLPSGEDPWDLVVSIAVILLPVVVPITALRVIHHRGAAGMPTSVRARTGIGIGLGLGLVLAAVAAQLLAAVTVGAPTASPAVLGLVVLTGVVALGALVPLVRAMLIQPTTPAEVAHVSPEPDSIDDVVALGHEGAAALRARTPTLATFVDRASEALEALAAAQLGPRRHHWAWVAGTALAAALGAVAWHTIREGSWATPVAPLVYGLAMAAVVGLGLVVLLPTLRIVRSA